MLLEVLRSAQDLGFIGPGPVSDQIDHGVAFADALDRGWRRGRAENDAHPRKIADLGSGGGLPALVVLRRWADVQITLIEAQHRRAEFLVRSLVELELEDRAIVLEERAEVAGREPELRGTYDAVSARAFGPPAATAECAAPLLRPGGVLVVSEPPNRESSPSRWPEPGLALLGMEPAEALGSEPGFVAIRQGGRCPDRYPRRVGVPAKRLLF